MNRRGFLLGIEPTGGLRPGVTKGSSNSTQSELPWSRMPRVLSQEGKKCSAHRLTAGFRLSKGYMAYDPARLFRRSFHMEHQIHAAQFPAAFRDRDSNRDVDSQQPAGVCYWKIG